MEIAGQARNDNPAPLSLWRGVGGEAWIGITIVCTFEIKNNNYTWKR
jgi:hypothetical protein